MSEYRTPSDIHPCLIYANAPEAIEWLCRAFGFVKCLVVPGEGATVQHPELRLGSSVIKVSSAKPGREAPSPSGANCVSLSVCVDNPDQHLATAIASGAKIIQPLRDEAYGARGYSACDLEGHNWYFGNYRPGAHWGASEDEGRVKQP